MTARAAVLALALAATVGGCGGDADPEGIGDRATAGEATEHPRAGGPVRTLAAPGAEPSTEKAGRPSGGGREPTTTTLRAPERPAKRQRRTAADVVIGPDGLTQRRVEVRTARALTVQNRRRRMVRLRLGRLPVFRIPPGRTELAVALPPGEHRLAVGGGETGVLVVRAGRGG